MKISGGSPLKGMGGKDKGRKGHGPAWIFCPRAPEFLVMPLHSSELYDMQ